MEISVHSNAILSNSKTTGNASSQQSGDFAAALVQVIGGDTTQGQTTESEPLQIIGAILPTILVQQTEEVVPVEPSQLIKLVEALLEQLDGLSDEEKVKLSENPDIQNWMAQANAILLTFVNATPSFSTNSDSQEGSQLDVLQLISTANSLQDTLKNVIAVMNNTGSLSKEQQGSVTKLLSSLDLMIAQQLGEEQKQQSTEPTVDSTNSHDEKDAKNSIHSKQSNAVIQTLVSNERIKATEAPQLVQFVQATGLKPLLSTSNHLSIQQAAGTEPDFLQEIEASDSIEAQPVSTAIAMQTQDLARTAQSAEQAKSAPVTMSAGQFAQEMSQLVFKNMKVTQLNGFSEAKITLMPEHLGQVDVKISLHNGQLMAQFITDTLTGKEMLENQLPQLRLALQAQGLNVDKLEVTQNNDQTSLFQDQRHQQSQQQQTKRQSSNNNTDYATVSGLNSELAEQELARQLAYGNNINVTV